MKVSDKPQAPAILPPSKELSVHIYKEMDWSLVVVVVVIVAIIIIMSVATEKRAV